MFCSPLQQSAMHLQYCLTQIKGGDMISLVMRILSHKCTGTVMIMQEVLKVSDLSGYRAVKTFLSTRLIMNFLGSFVTRTKGTSSCGPRYLATVWNLEFWKWPFQRFSRSTLYFPLWTPCCFQYSEYRQDWEQCRWNVPGVPLGK